MHQNRIKQINSTLINKTNDINDSRHREISQDNKKIENNNLYQKPVLKHNNSINNLNKPKNDLNKDNHSPFANKFNNNPNNKNRTVSVDKININKIKRESINNPREEDLNLDISSELFNELITTNMIDWDLSTPISKSESINNLAN